MSHLFVVGSGALTVCTLPDVVPALRDRYPGLDVRIGLTMSACRFVASSPLALISGHPVVIDTWQADDETSAMHVDLVEWADAFVVFPATAHLIARFSLGLCDTPFLVALSCTRAPIGIAPSLPPGMAESPAHRRHVDELARRSNVSVAPTHVGRSGSTGAEADGATGPWTEVMEMLRSRFFPSHPDWQSTSGDLPADQSLGSISLAWKERTS